MRTSDNLLVLFYNTHLSEAFGWLLPAGSMLGPQACSVASGVLSAISCRS